MSTANPSTASTINSMNIDGLRSFWSKSALSRPTAEWQNNLFLNGYKYGVQTAVKAIMDAYLTDYESHSYTSHNLEILDGRLRELYAQEITNFGTEE
jgi:hypothetical protein